MGKTKIKRRVLFLVGVFVGLVLLGWYYLKFSPPLKKSYNVLMISVDTLRADHVSLYGYPKNTTPNISAWAKKDGVIFTNAYTQIPITYPSFASTMTGLSPYQTSIFNNGKVKEDSNGQLYVEQNEGNHPISQDAPTFAEILKKQGYNTGAFIINASLRPSSTGLDRGFDDYNVTSVNYFLDSSGVEGFVQDGLAWLDTKKDASRPFFLWMHFLDPHEPYTPQSEDACRFAGELCSSIKAHDIDYFTKQQESLQGCHFSPLSRQTVAIQEALYDAEIYRTDAYIGEIFSFVKANHLDDNTIIIFYSDHGEGFDHNYYFSHSEALYESSVKIPYIISTPESRGKSKTIPFMIDNTRTMATLLSLLHLDKQIPNRQESFANAIIKNDFSDSEDKTLYYINQSKNKFAIREGNMKYIYTQDKAKQLCLSQDDEELYNITSDPEETKNLVKNQPAVASKLRAKLLEHISHSAISFDLPQKKVKIPTPSVKIDESQKILEELRDMGY